MTKSSPTAKPLPSGQNRQPYAISSLQYQLVILIAIFSGSFIRDKKLFLVGLSMDKKFDLLVKII